MMNPTFAPSTRQSERSSDVQSDEDDLSAWSYKKKRLNLKRSTAERLLREITERARAINRRSDLPLRISRMVVFGSYVNSQKERLGDLDMMVWLDKVGDQAIHASLRQDRINLRDSISPFRTIFQRYAWPELEMFQMLRGRSVGLSIHTDAEEDLLKPGEFIQIDL